LASIDPFRSVDHPLVELDAWLRDPACALLPVLVVIGVSRYALDCHDCPMIAWPVFDPDCLITEAGRVVDYRGNLWA